MAGKFKANQVLQVGLAHIEKVVLAGIGLIVVILLIYQPLMGDTGKWSVFKTHPNEFQAKVEAAQLAHTSARWSDAAEKLAFEGLADVRASVGARKNQIDVSRFEYVTPFHFPPYEKKDRDRMPVLLPVMEVLADSSQAIMRPVPTDDEDDEELAREADGDEKVSGRIVGQPGAARVGPRRSSVAPRKKRQPGAGNFGTNAGGAGGFGAGAGSPMGGGAGVDPGSAELGGGGMPMGPTGAQVGGQGGAEGFQAGGGSVYNASQRVGTAQGYNFVSIRGLVMLKNQAEQFQRALNLDTLSEALGRLEILDFELERQTAVSGSNPWNGDWKKINLMAARDIVLSVEWEADVVSADLTDQVVSMPLPRREAGEWDWFGTHPRLRLLSSEARERQVLENEQALKESENQKSSAKQRRKKGGFSAFQHDIRGARGTAMQGASGNKIREDATKKMGQDGFQGFTGQFAGIGAGGQRGADQLQASLAGQVLLFRYLDFDVIPGNAYRYRVRLVIRNPNYEKPPSMLHESAVASADQETLATPWSAPSGVWNVRRQTVVPGSAVIRRSVRYFLSRVLPERRTTPGMADFNVYQWYPAAGTDINGKIKAQFGEFIYQELETLVLRPAEATFKPESVILQTGDVLLDIETPTSLDESDHPDLPIEELKKRRNVAVAFSGALVVNRYGQLISHGRSPLEMDRELGESQQLAYDRQPWQDLRNKKQPGAVANNSFPFSAAGGNAKGNETKKGRRKKNPIRRKNAYGGGVGGMGGGMGGGMEGAPPEIAPEVAPAAVPEEAAAGLEVEAVDKRAAAKKGSSKNAVKDYIQEVIARSRR